MQPRGTRSYLLERYEEGAWEHVATIDVPRRTQRRTVLRDAVKDNADLLKVARASEGEILVRLIPEDEILKVRVALQQPDPVLVLGDA